MSSASALRSPSRRTHGTNTHRQHPSQPHSNLHLAQLPRFHPANFPSANSSTVASPDVTMNSPQPPISPRTEQFQRRNLHNPDLQRQLYISYQRELLARGPNSPNAINKLGTSPSSPRLEPLGSPGPVTPLELGGEDDYLFAGAKSAGLVVTNSEELVEKFIAKELRTVGSRPGSRSASRPSSRAGGER